METLPQAEDTQAISRQHANGEVFVAPNLEVARGMCPVLGKMTLEESGLLMELQAMGRAQMAEQPDTPHEKPHFKKIEKHLPEQSDAEHLIQATAPSSQRPAMVSQTQGLEELAVVTRNTPLPTEPYAIQIPPLKTVQPKEAVELIPSEITAPIAREVSASAIAEEVKFTQRLAFEEDLQTAMRLQQTVHEPPERAEQSIAEPVASADQATQKMASVKPPREADSEFAVPPRPSEKPTMPEAISPAPPVANEEAEITENLPVEELLNVDETVLYPILIEADEAEAAKANEELLTRTIAEEGPEDVPRVRLSVEAQNAPAVPELPTPIEHIEIAIADLAEALEAADPPKVERIHAIIEKIIAIPDAREEIIDQPETPADQQLEALFIELFEEAHVAYTPELIKSFVQLTQAHRPNQRLRITQKTKEKIIELPTEAGTHEFLQKLQRSLIAMKQTINNVYELGKSALRVYNLGNAVPEAVIG